MNSLKFYTGGHPLYYPDDITFLQNGIREAIQGISVALGNNDFILKGCKITYASGNASVTAGFIVLNGEVFRVDAATVVVGGDPAKFVINEIADATTDPVTYADATTKDVHMIRTAVIMGESLVPVGAYSKYESEVSINFDTNNGTQFSLTNSWALGPLPLPNAHYKKHGRRVQFGGDIKFTSTPPATNLPFATLPVGSRPAQNTIRTALSVESITNEYLDNPLITWVRIKTNGECFCDPNLATGTRSIILDNVNFDII